VSVKKIPLIWSTGNTLLSRKIDFCISRRVDDSFSKISAHNRNPILLPRAPITLATWANSAVGLSCCEVSREQSFRDGGWFIAYSSGLK